MSTLQLDRRPVFDGGTERDTGRTARPNVDVDDAAADQPLTKPGLTGRLGVERELAQRLLTGRELVVLLHLLSDLTLAEIAATLFVSRNTVKSQVRSLYRKIGATSRGEAISWAHTVGLR